MKEIACRMNAYIQKHPFDSGNSGGETVLDQLYQAYAESHESDPEEIGDDSRNWRNFCTPCPLRTTMPCSISVAAYAALRICLLFVFWKERNTAALSMAEESRDSCKLTVNIAFFSFP